MGNSIKLLWSLGLVISLVDVSLGFWLGFCVIPGFEDFSCSYKNIEQNSGFCLDFICYSSLPSLSPSVFPHVPYCPLSWLG